MYDSILAPLDGSNLAECVLPHAAAIAQSFNAEITLLRMLEKNQANSSAQFSDLLNWQISKTEVTRYLEKIKARFQESGIQVRSIVLEGLVAEGITNYAQTHGVKLIILSSHGHSGLTQWGISSNTQKIILSAPSSVLLIRAQHHDLHTVEFSIPQHYQRILVPLDGSHRAENVLPPITQIARFHNSQVHIVQVVRPPEMARHMPLSHEDIELSDRIVALNREEAKHYLEEVKSRSYLNGIAVQTHLITSDNVNTTLHKLTEQEHIDLVTLSAHGYSGNHQWPYGSMVNNFIMFGKVSLLIVQDLPAKQKQMLLNMQSRGHTEH